MKSGFSKVWFATLSFAVSAAAWADPPARVGRLVAQGEVMIAHAGGEWRRVAQNYPVTDGDNVFVAPGARAEVDFGAGLAWLNGGSTVYFERFDDNHFRARMNEGQMIVRVRELDRGDTARIDTRNGSVDLVTPGLYRVESGVNFSASDLVHVKFGQASLSSNAGYESLRGGDAVEYGGNRFGFLSIRGDDAFGAWVDTRDRRYESQRYAYVSPHMVGWRDLDEHGAWRELTNYGWVWFPRRVSHDWAPYRFGHWTFVSPWGWTWVDDAPWGFAPFHYGRWINLNGRWGWTPGPYERRPVYSPALVAWHGNMGGVNVSIGSNALVSWTPLSWGEAYYPTYTVSANHWRLMNRPYVHHSVTYNSAPPRGITYRNWNVQNGTTAVEAAVIASAGAVAPAVRMVPGMAGAPREADLYPVRESIKPSYQGAPTYVGGGSNPGVAVQPPQRAMTQQPAVMVREGAINVAPVQAPAPVAPVRSQPLPPVQMQPAVPQPPVMVREAGAVPVAPVTVAPAAPRVVPAQPAAPSRVGVPMQVGTPLVQPPVAAPAPAVVAKEQATATQAQDARRIAPAQGRGEAPVQRAEQPYVEPAPRATRAMPQMPARTMAPVVEEIRKP